MADEININFKNENVLCRIPVGARVVGDFSCPSGVLLDGAIEGGVVKVANGALIVMQTGTLKGRIHIIGNLYVLGDVSGENAVVEGLVTVASTGKLTGSMKANDFMAYAGSVMQGSFAKRDLMGS